MSDLDDLEDELHDDALPEIPPELPVLPLREAVVFPLAVVPVLVGQPRSVHLVDDAMTRDRLVAMVLRHDASEGEAGPDDVFRVGTVGIVRQLLRGPDGTLRLAVQGLERVRLRSFVRTEPWLVAAVEPAPVIVEQGVEMEALLRSVQEVFFELVSASNHLPDELAIAVRRLNDPRFVTSLIASTGALELPLRQELLETDSMAACLRRILDVLQHELAVRRLETDITERTQKQISDTQREYVLREQLRAIQKELGDGDEEGELGELRRMLAEAKLSAEARKEADRELHQLEHMPPASMEYGVARTHLDWLATLPWGRLTGGRIDVVRAQGILDEDHYDLEKVKERIVEYLAVRKLREERQQAGLLASAPAPPPPPPAPATGPQTPSAAVPGSAPAMDEEDVSREPILCFVGPPGVGKTSLGHSIARAMGRRFVRISLGGVHDESEIRGHRRTYVGAMPGRVLQALRRAETADPVFMLDEVDKLSVGFQGNPSAALLEVLDPAQNGTFTDTYLAVPFDLRQVFFITTANTTETIPPPLLDRMEVVRLAGYTQAEKLHIARRHLLPKLLRGHGLMEGEVLVDDAVIRRVIAEYTREAGVREVGRELAALLRKGARRIGEGENPPIGIAAADLPGLLGPPKFQDEQAERLDRPGVATGLAWTPSGGDVLFVEAAIMPGAEERLLLTGMLGDVMRESAQAALTYLRSHAAQIGLDPRIFEHAVVHLHVPAGAIPKDGPSAGVTMLAALASAATGRLTTPGLAMTGEITLRGKVLAVGGLKEKVLAAHRAGIHRVLLPRRSESQLAEVPDDVRRDMRFVPVDTAAEVLAEALLPAEGAAPGREPEAESPPVVH